jgi:hypothetical protein
MYVCSQTDYNSSSFSRKIISNQHESRGSKGGKVRLPILPRARRRLLGRRRRARLRNRKTGKLFTAFVCSRCLEKGLETRVTCRAFVLAEPSA